MKLIQQIEKDKQRIKDNLAHCLFCIYNQQGITYYFSEMMEITEVMKQHFDAFSEAVRVENSKEAKNTKAAIGIITQILTQLQFHTSPTVLKQMIQEIIEEIMKNIRKQIIQKMRQLNVVVKQPLSRRLSFDDFYLCFESFNRKAGYGDYVPGVTPFGCRLGGLGKDVFAPSNVQYSESKGDSQDFSSSSYMSQKSQFKEMYNDEDFNLEEMPPNLLH